jgi:Spy/CpxP family protein refolding chaperone
MSKKSFITLAFVAALLAVAFFSFFAARTVNGHHTNYQHGGGNGFHQFLHEKLALTSVQERQIQTIEDTYDQQRQALEAKLRQANAELATVFQEERSYTPRVQEKIDTLNHAMGELQKVTLAHIYAMYPHLTQEQQQKLQTYVTHALVQPPE